MKVQLPKESIYLVASQPDYESAAIIAAFKTKNGAEKFIEKCKQIINAGDEIEFIGTGRYTYLLDDHSLDSLKIIESETSGENIPFFNK